MKLDNPYEVHHYSFDPSIEVLERLSAEFSPKEVAHRFAALAGKDGERFFTSYGEDLARRTYQLGEEKPDATWETMRIANQEAREDLLFPLFGQRLLELAYLATQPHISQLDMVENNRKRLIYRIESCALFNALGEACEQGVAQAMPCRHGCLSLAAGAFKPFNLAVKVAMEKLQTRDGCCQFTVTL